jgi:molybdate transport system substrate-binding protein
MRAGSARLKPRRFVLAAVCCGAAFAVPSTISTSPSLTVSVAASVGDAITELARRYEAATGVHVQINAGSSSTLARQIVEGAPIDVFISADETQMRVASNGGRIVAGSEVALLSNQLVVVTGHNSRERVRQPRDLASSAVRRIAMGQPDSVPAGVYGRAWLTRLGLWSAVLPKVLPLPTVRAALAAVREGRADAAIVYATDARTAPDVTVGYSVPIDEGPPIRYPAAILVGPRQQDAARFLSFLQSRDARQVFEAAGFSVLAGR